MWQTWLHYQHYDKLEQKQEVINLILQHFHWLRSWLVYLNCQIHQPLSFLIEGEQFQKRYIGF